MFSANSSSIENTAQSCEEMQCEELLPHTCFDPTHANDVWSATAAAPAASTTPFGAAATVPAASAATTGFSFGASKPAATTTATATAAAPTSGKNLIRFNLMINPVFHIDAHVHNHFEWQYLLK